MTEDLTRAEYDTLLRQDFATFAARCFHDLNPQTEFAMNWHVEVIAAKLTAVRQRKIRRLIIHLPPRHLKSLMASIAFPAWCLGHDPSMPILCVSYAQDLADKLARDCRSVMLSPWYRTGGSFRPAWLRIGKPCRSLSPPLTDTGSPPPMAAC